MTLGRLERPEEPVRFLVSLRYRRGVAEDSLMEREETTSADAPRSKLATAETNERFVPGDNCVKEPKIP